MKKALTLFILTVTMAVPAFATYIVVLRDGTRYAAKAKWTVTKNGKALVLLENGQSLQLDPSLIDVARSEQLTKIGAGASANVIDMNTNAAPVQTQEKQQPSLGDQIRLRRNVPQKTAPAAPVTAAPAPVSSGTMSDEVLEKFDRAFENLGIFEKKLISTGARSLRADLTVDTEDRVFNAISATSLLITRNAGVTGAQIDMVELFMKTTAGGAAGRFQMNRADAEALDKKTISQQEYFVRKVIY
jgi:hypothetical protein